jgi:hypothetical protein
MIIITGDLPIGGARRRFIAGLSAGVVLLLGLLAYALFRYPMEAIGHSPKPNPPAWFGSTGALAFWLLLGVLIGALYVWVGIVGTRQGGGAPAWPQGVACGLLVGLVGLACAVLADSAGQAGLLGSLGYLALLLGCPLVGAHAARRTGLVGAGAVAAFWAAFVSALLFALSMVALDILFARTLIHGAWAHDPTCAQYGGNTLAGCEIGDDLGACASVLILIPLLGTLLGAVGGVLGAASRRARCAVDGPPLPLWQGEARAPLQFALAMVILFVVAIVGKLY